MVMVHAGSAVSDRLRREANAYNLLRCDGERLTIAVRALGDAGFAEIASSSFNRGAAGWAPL
jgi:hypothetical protein